MLREGEKMLVCFSGTHTWKEAGRGILVFTLKVGHGGRFQRGEGVLEMLDGTMLLGDLTDKKAHNLNQHKIGIGGCVIRVPHL